MLNFNYYVPTDIYFGEGQLEKLPGLLAAYGKNVLMVYGGGSVKKTGLYDRIAKLLADAGLNLFELPGVEPNPRIQSVREGVRLCHEHAIDAVLGVGGGSSIDCAKAVAAGAKYDGDAWDLFMDPSLITEALPILSVLTLSATGSEMDGFSVVTNLETHDKIGINRRVMYPRASILDPTITYTVGKFQSASGVADILSHILESYFNPMEEESYISCRLSEGLLKTVFKFGKTVVDDPTNYEARANIMWCSSLAINGLNKVGVDFSRFSWTCHAIEHPLSAYYDVTHGAGLAALTPVWMEMVLSDETVGKFAEYGRNVFGFEGADYDVAHAAIDATRDFLISLGLPMHLRELGVPDDSHFGDMADKALDRCLIGYVPFGREQIIELLNRCL